MTDTVTRQRRAARAGTRRMPERFAARILAFVLLLIAALVTLVALFQAPYHTTIAVGDPETERRVTGFHGPEGTGGFTYRWTTERAAITLPLGVFPGEADVVLSGDRPGSAPPAVTLSVDGAPPARVASTRAFAPYAVSLSAATAPRSPTETAKLVIVPADTVTPARDNRALGVAVQRVVVFTNPLRFGPVVPPVLAALLVLGVAAVLGLLALSLTPSVRWFIAVAYGPSAIAAAYLALRRADDPGEQARAVVGLTVVALVAVLLTQRDAVMDRPWARGLVRLDGRVAVLMAMALAAGYAVYASHLMLHRLYDDAYITLRYARNFAAGQGLVYNPGEPPVEGYTNFSLTVLLAAAAKLGLPLVTTDRVLSILAGVAVVAATYRLTARVLPGAPGIVRAVPSLVLAACGWFAFFAVIGLETHLCALCVVLAACLVIERRFTTASFVFAAAYLTRPEGAGLWAVTLAWLVLAPISDAAHATGGLTNRQDAKTPRGNERYDSVVERRATAPRSLRPLVSLASWRLGGSLLRGFAMDCEPVVLSRGRAIGRFALPFALIAGAHELFRLTYYHEPLPNTFYDKVGTTVAQLARGGDYLLHILPTLHPILLALLIAAAACVPSPFVDGRAVRYVAVLAVAFLAYVALVGGDFIGPRFLMHIFPLLVVLALAGIVALVGLVVRFLRAPDRGGFRPLASIAAALIALWYFLPLTPPGTFMPEQTHMRLVTGLTALGQYLRTSAAPESTLAIEVAGVVPFESGLPTIDMLGLNDAHIAHTIAATGEARAGHEKEDPDYVLARRPTYIAVGMTSRGRPGRGLDRPGFDAHYERIALVRMNAVAVTPDLVLPVTPAVDVEAAMRQGYTYALYRRKD